MSVRQPSLDTEHPGRQLVPITVHDTNDIATGPVRALYVGSSGDVSVVALDDAAAVTLPGVQAGTILPISVRRVRATGTTVPTPNVNIVGIR